MAKSEKKNKNKYKVFLFFLTIVTGILTLWQNPEILEKITERAPKIEFKDSMTVHYIDIGQGDSQLIIIPDGSAVLIDAGPNSEEDKLLSYLKSQDIDELEYVIFTHPHEDHIGGADMVLKKFKVNNVIISDVTYTSATFLRMLEAIEESDAKLIIAAAGQNYTFGDASFNILAPVSDNYTSLNDWSVVLRMDYGITSFLFTGDAEIISENDMMRKFNESEFKCDVYKAGHHGSTTSNSEAFLTLCNPIFAVVSCGKGNDYGHPHSEILNLFSNMKIQIYRTDIDGTVVFKSDGNIVTRVK